MAFTTATVALIQQGKSQLAGLFNEMWAVNLTVDPSSIAAGAEDAGTFTIPGLMASDMVLGVSPGTNLTATGEADYTAWVSAANTLSIRLTNLHASSAVDLPATTWKVLIGRPNW